MNASDLRQLLRLRQAESRARLLADDRYADAKKLNRYEFQVFSQNGEDGIIAEIFRRIGVATRTFVEIGAGDGTENNTTFLLAQGWSGGWIEGDDAAAARVMQQFQGPIDEGRLRLVKAFITTERIDDLLDRLETPPEPDLVSLDVDRNTYWIWAALSAVRPRVVVVEYNADFPPPVDWKVEYHARRVWNGTSYFGASLKAYEILGRRLGYNLVGCDLCGVNAFFVREDLCGDHFAQPFDAETHYEPLRFFLIGRQGHPACFSDAPPVPIPPMPPRATSSPPAISPSLPPPGGGPR